MGAEPPFEEVACTSIRVRPSRARTAIAWICGIAALMMAPAALSLGTEAPLLLLIFLGAAAVVASTLLERRLRFGRAVTLLPTGMRVPRGVFSLHVPRTAVESAYDTEAGLVLSLKNGGEIELGLMGGRGDAILKHLGLTLDQAALTAPLRGMIGPFTRGLLATIASFPFLMGLVVSLRPRGDAQLLGTFAALATAITLGVLVANRLRPRVVVGVDGIRLIGVLRPKFVSYEKIREVRIVDQQGFLSLFVNAGLDTHLLPLIGQSGEQAAALARRVDEGRQRHRGAAATRDLSVLDRAGMPFDAWRENLRRLSLASGGFRAAALEQRDFEEVMRDPTAPIERRVGAALAMREAGAEAFEKIRIAASTSAEPRVRIALEGVAGEEIDEDVVEGALRKRATY